MIIFRSMYTIDVYGYSNDIIYRFKVWARSEERAMNIVKRIKPRYRTYKLNNKDKNIIKHTIVFNLIYADPIIDKKIMTGRSFKFKNDNMLAYWCNVLDNVINFDSDIAFLVSMYESDNYVYVI